MAEPYFNSPPLSPTNANEYNINSSTSFPSFFPSDSFLNDGPIPAGVTAAAHDNLNHNISYQQSDFVDPSKGIMSGAYSDYYSSSSFAIDGADKLGEGEFAQQQNNDNQMQNYGEDNQANYNQPQQQHQQQPSVSPSVPAGSLVNNDNLLAQLLPLAQLFTTLTQIKMAQDQQTSRINNNQSPQPQAPQAQAFPHSHSRPQSPAYNPLPLRGPSFQSSHPHAQLFARRSVESASLPPNSPGHFYRSHHSSTGSDAGAGASPVPLQLKGLRKQEGRQKPNISKLALRVLTQGHGFSHGSQSNGSDCDTGTPTSSSVISDSGSFYGSEGHWSPSPMPAHFSPAYNPYGPNVDMNVVAVGTYTRAERRLRILRYRQKKLARKWKKKILYKCRKNFADNRPRIGGRFVKMKDNKTENGSKAGDETDNNDESQRDKESMYEEAAESSEDEKIPTFVGYRSG